MDMFNWMFTVERKCHPVPLHYFTDEETEAQSGGRAETGNLAFWLETNVPVPWLTDQTVHQIVPAFQLDRLTPVLPLRRGSDARPSEGSGVPRCQPAHDPRFPSPTLPSGSQPEGPTPCAHLTTTALMSEATPRFTVSSDSQLDSHTSCLVS